MAQLVRYGTVGITNSLLSAAVYAGLVAVGGTPAISAAVAFAAGAANGYRWNSRWTFATADGRSPVRYVTVQAAGLAVTYALVMLLVGDAGRVGAYITAAIVVTLATFAVNRRWTFRAPQQLHSHR